MYAKHVVSLAVLTTLTLACGGPVMAEEADSIEALHGGPCPTEPVLISGLRSPESAYFHAPSRSWFLSMRAGDPQLFQGPGWLTRVDQRGRVLDEVFVDGLAYPTGVTGTAQHLFVADLDRIRVVDIRRRAIVDEIPVEGALFINDVELRGQVLYASDSIRGVVYEIRLGRAPEVVASPAFFGPNGLEAWRGKLYVGNTGPFEDFAVESTLLEYDVTTDVARALPGVSGKFDGLVAVGRSLWVTDFRGRLLEVDPTTGVRRDVDLSTYGLVASADLGWDPICKTFGIPDLFAGQLLLLPKRSL